MKRAAAAALFCTVAGLAWAAPVLQETASQETKPQQAPKPPGAPPTSAPPTSAQEKPAKPAADDTPLMLEMKKMDAAMLRLKSRLRDPKKNAESLAELVKMEEAALASKQLEPKMAAHLKDDERAKFLVDYRKGMAALLQQMLELETALLDGNAARVKELERKLEQAQTDGHNSFTEGE